MASGTAGRLLFEILRWDCAPASPSLGRPTPVRKLDGGLGHRVLERSSPFFEPRELAGAAGIARKVPATRSWPRPIKGLALDRRRPPVDQPHDREDASRLLPEKAGLARTTARVLGCARRETRTETRGPPRPPALTTSIAAARKPDGLTVGGKVLDREVRGSCGRLLVLCLEASPATMGGLALYARRTPRDRPRPNREVSTTRFAKMDSPMRVIRVIPGYEGQVGVVLIESTARAPHATPRPIPGQAEDFSPR